MNGKNTIENHGQEQDITPDVEAAMKFISGLSSRQIRSGVDTVLSSGRTLKCEEDTIPPQPDPDADLFESEESEVTVSPKTTERFKKLLIQLITGQRNQMICYVSPDDPGEHYRCIVTVDAGDGRDQEC